MATPMTGSGTAGIGISISRARGTDHARWQCVDFAMTLSTFGLEMATGEMVPGRQALRRNVEFARLTDAPPRTVDGGCRSGPWHQSGCRTSGLNGIVEFFRPRWWALQSPCALFASASAVVAKYRGKRR